MRLSNVKDATNLYNDQRLFELHKVYTVKRIYNNELNTEIYALMDGDTYSGSLTALAVNTTAHLFQPGFTVKIRVTKVNATKPATYSTNLNRLQAWTHGRGKVWHEAEEGEKADKADKADNNKGNNDKGNKGFDRQAEPKCESPPWPSSEHED